MNINKDKQIVNGVENNTDQLATSSFKLTGFVQNLIESRRKANYEVNKQRLLSEVTQAELRENTTIEEMIFDVNSLPRQCVKALRCLEIAKRMGIISNSEFEEIKNTLCNATPGIFSKKKKFSFKFRIAVNRFLEQYNQMKVE